MSDYVTIRETIALARVAPCWPDLPRVTHELAAAWAERLRNIADPNAWAIRAVLLIDALSHEFERDLMLGLPADSIAFAQEHMITAVLEKLDERELKEPFAAIFYALSAHEEWRAAAQQVLAGRGAFKYPQFNRIAALVRLRHPDVPLTLSDNLIAQVEPCAGPS